MKTIFTFLLSLICLGTQAQIISQYVETNSGSTPKGIEIWNNTAATLDFSTNSLVIEKGVNGAAPSPDFTLSTGTLAPGDVLVIGTADIGTYLTSSGSTATFHLKAFTFNGDDALVVKYGGTTTDVFGIPGTDPGSSWSGNGVDTRNQNIQLNPAINTGSTGFSDPSTRFSTVSTDPVGTGGLVGFGVAPLTSAPAALMSIDFMVTTDGTTAQLSWNCDKDEPVSIQRILDGEKTVIVARESSIDGSYADRALENGQYIYKIYQDHEGDMKVLDTRLVNITSNEIIKAYPNPATDNFTISPLREMDAVSIFSVDGKKVMYIPHPSESQNINTSALESGAYYIHARNQTLKIIVE